MKKFITLLLAAQVLALGWLLALPTIAPGATATRESVATRDHHSPPVTEFNGQPAVLPITLASSPPGALAYAKITCSLVAGYNAPPFIRHSHNLPDIRADS